jgi:hypothetical protein
MRLYRSRCGLAGAQEGYSRRCSDRLDEPSQAIPRHGCIPAEPAAVSPGKIIVPRIVIGGVILEQPAGGGIGAIGVGSPCGNGGHGRCCPGRETNALDSARSRLWSATSKSTTSQISLSYSFIDARFERSPKRRGKRPLAGPSA